MNIQHEQQPVIVWAPRDKSFQKLIAELIWKGRGKQKKIKNMKEYMREIMNENGMKLFSKAFTHRTADEKNNYESLEQLGDVTINKSIVWYLSRRFPQLDCPEGVKVIARLRINLVSKKSFATFGENLGLWNFVSADEETRRTKMKKTLEDVFEAFFGAVEKLLDNIQIGLGYKICYNIVENLFDEMDISLRYRDLYDAKTRLKETFDFFSKEGIGQMKFISDRKEVEQNAWFKEGGNGGDKITYYIHEVSVFRKDGNKEVFLGKGSAALKADAEQKASEIALQTLVKMKFDKPIPHEYALFDKM